jgi:hypothetical protein
MSGIEWGAEFEDQATALARRAARDREWDEQQRAADAQEARHSGFDHGAHHQDLLSRPVPGRPRAAPLDGGAEQVPQTPGEMLSWLARNATDPADRAAGRRATARMFETERQRALDRAMASRLPRSEFRGEPEAVTFTHWAAS